MSNDIIQFPKRETKTEMTEEERLQQAAKELEAVNLQRHSALEGLQKKVKNLLENEKINAAHMSPASVEAFRDAVGALNMVLTSIEAHEKIIDMITHDIIGAATNIDQLSMHLFQASALLQGTAGALKEKGLITEQDIKQAWLKIVQAKKTQSTPE